MSVEGIAVKISKIERDLNAFDLKISELEKINSEIKSEVDYELRGGIGNKSLFVYNSKGESNEMKRQLSLLSLDASFESKRKREQLLLNEVVDKSKRKVIEKVKREIDEKVHNEISIKKKKEKVSYGFSIIEEIHIKIILWVMSIFDNDYIQARLESKLLSYRKGE